MSSTSTVKTPNQEQLAAIDHTGGKILSAGAGSGKTFVIIEHIIKKLEELKKEIPKNDWSQQIPFKLQRLVLMTFTKKAAGEMSIRLMNRIDILCEQTDESSDFEYWTIVRKYLSLMNVTTISSFCHGLISQGHFKDIGSKVEIVSTVEYKNKISLLFNAWFTQRESGLKQVFQANSSALISAMIDVFTSPELRLIWSDSFKKQSAEEELKPFIEQMLSILDLNSVFESSTLIVEEKEQSKSWYALVKGFDGLKNSLGILTPLNIKSYITFAINYGRLPSAVKNMSEEQKLYLANVKELVSFLRDCEEDVLNFLDHYDVYSSWVEVFKDVFNYINDHYLDEKGFAFSDLEYYVCKGLQDNSLAIKVRSQYDYFIVDEFQDTSSVQYDILQKLIGEDNSRLFCVGDRKQAIYGFRGGELQVFTQCSKRLGEINNLWLKNNFRSQGNVINFNNNFFTQVFPLGTKFEGIDRHSVKMESQNIPSHSENLGIVEKIGVEIQNVINEKELDVDALESKALTEKIKTLIEDDYNSICVLYRKLRPSTYLLELLVNNSISYNAQIKIEYSEDPIINLFLRMVEIKINLEDEKKYQSTLFLLATHFDVLGLNFKPQDIANKFLGDLEILGLRLAFHKLIFSLGLNNSLYVENSQLIDSICKVCKNDPAQAYFMLSSESDERYSLDSIHVGKTKRVTIMSAHASKGLEFDAVLLGGIHSNGNQMGKTETVGKLPKSFRWKKVYNQKTFFKSPAYYLEAELDKAKDFSESKRLLYVACTRAVKYLGWTDLYFLKEGVITSLGNGSNHWIKAMRLFDAHELVQATHLTLKNDVEISKIQMAMMLKDPMGLLVNTSKSGVGLFAETSVTRLAHLAQCPFKFYLSNICKIEAPGTKIVREFDEELESAEEHFYSSKERGIEVHKWLSEILTNKKNIEDYQGNDKEKIQWALVEAQKFSTFEIISERLIKFSLFGQMISGTPDLVYLKENELAVWDFKTGSRDSSQEEHYWFQLICYGFAYANLKQFTPEKKITLSLVYVDEKSSINKELSLEEMTEYLFGKWSMTESLHQVNKQHCGHCEYSSLCHKNATSSP
jgi:ATP-dependent helicase/nuclease subunit A